jgi:hypothetical protein
MKMAREETRPTFLICIRNDGYPVSLEPRKVYQALSDDVAASRGFVRVIDESGEDYLFPEDLFIPIELPQEAQRAFAQAS